MDGATKAAEFYQHAFGATVVMPVADMFWADRYGQLRDPFGILWAMDEPIRR